MPDPSPFLPLKSYPRLAQLGVVLFVLVAVGLSARSFRAAETPPWKAGQEKSNQDPTPSDKKAAETHGEPDPFSFVAYNVKNWLVSYQSPAKSDEAKDAVIRMLAVGEPDIIGLSEIGSEDDVREIQEDLKQAGIDLPHFFYTGGADKVRHLALISRYPITDTVSPDLSIPGKEYSVQRGILDATITIGEGEVRFIGLHLKSKRPVPEFDEAVIRLDESKIVRKHLDSIFEADPETMIIAYGDFNDTTRSLSTRMVTGRYNSRKAMKPVDLKDSRGENWTHNWDYQDIYSRIDFVTVSRGISSHVDTKASKIIDEDFWEDASDHRPLLVRFK